MAPEIRKAGLKTVEAFGVKSRFIHFEFFVLDEDQEGLGRKGDVVGLEVNMRPSGEMDVYKIWADMIAFGTAQIAPGITAPLRAAGTDP